MIKNYDKKHLTMLIKEVTSNGKSLEKINSIWCKKIPNLLDELLYLPEWSNNHFVFLQCFLNFIKNIPEGSMMSVELSEVEDCAINYHDDLSSELNVWLKDAELIGIKSPIFWMELAEQYKIPFNYYIIRKIILAHFKLNHRITHKDMPRGETYSVFQTANFINNQLSLNFEPHNVIECCVETNFFSAYINRNLFEFRSDDDSLLYSLSLPYYRSLEQIEFFIEHHDLQLAYHSPYQGLIRLKKKPGYGEDQSQTLLQIRDGGDIRFDNGGLSIQLSFRECVENRTFVSSLTEREMMFSKDKKITLSDLLFRKEELEKFCEEYRKNNAESKYNADYSITSDSSRSASIDKQQKLKRAAIKKIFLGGSKNLCKSKWKRIFEKEKKNGLHGMARVEPSSKQAVYSQDGLVKWLTQEGYFTPSEIEKMLNPQAAPPKTPLIATYM